MPPRTSGVPKGTSREHEILQLVAEGYSSTGIARRLTISARTAEAHRANVMRKLRLRNQAALIRHALSRGVLAPVLVVPRPPALRRRGRRNGRGPRLPRPRTTPSQACVGLRMDTSARRSVGSRRR